YTHTVLQSPHSLCTSITPHILENISPSPSLSLSRSPSLFHSLTHSPASSLSYSLTRSSSFLTLEFSLSVSQCCTCLSSALSPLTPQCPCGFALFCFPFFFCSPPSLPRPLSPSLFGRPCSFLPSPSLPPS